MANVSITAANVVVTDSTQTEKGIAGETVTAGMILYKKAVDNLWYKADALTAEKAGQYGLRMALVGATANQPVTLLAPGQSITIGSAMTAGVPYFLSATATSGLFCPAADLSTGNLLTTIGYSSSASVLVFNPLATGIAKG